MEPTSLIPAGAWLWKQYGKSLSEKAAGAVRQEWKRTRWHAAAAAYRTKIKKLYGSMQIMGMAEPVPLDDIFTDVYMLDKPTAFARWDIERLRVVGEADALPQAKRSNGLRLVRKQRNLFILGKPGAGKTTFLKYLALHAAGQNIDRIPIFITLKSWADSGLELMPFIAERFDICDFPDAQPFVQELLKSGSAIVLFDGLDEVSQEFGERDKQTRAIHNFVEKYDRAQCLITCRIAASDYSFQPFDYVEIADFTKRQIEKFVTNWFRSREGQQDEETIKKFQKEFGRSDNRGLRDLARTPLLLTLLCLAFEETLTFPRRRAEIYQEALDALLKKWDSSRRIKRDEVYRKLSLGHKENLLASVAAETFAKNEYFIPQPELEKRIVEYVKKVPPHETDETTDGEVILKAIEAQHGIFVERAHRVYSFSHLTFQEYFTARYVVANTTKGALVNFARKHCADKRWREVFLLTTSLLSNAGGLMKALKLNVDHLLSNNKKLQAVLVWADKKSRMIEAERWLGRANCLIIEFLYNSHTTELNNAMESLLDRDLTSKFELIEFDLDLAMAFRIDLFLAREEGPDDKPVAANLQSLVRAIAELADRASQLGLTELVKDLANVSVPEHIHKPDKEWSDFSNRVRAVMIKNRNIGHDWQLTAEDEQQLADYLNATKLLQDCLELAVMPPEEKLLMLNSLYMP